MNWTSVLSCREPTSLRAHLCLVKSPCRLFSSGTMPEILKDIEDCVDIQAQIPRREELVNGLYNLSL